ncbi:hypothetical protein [Streptomyces sp. NBC_01601]|uniref:hypothetical protein n=1 Tax=Streptomyces sp. NBC_01601 TaxID=2975892 RepID=UPI002E29C43C|nr:hypothetical protein [Streptomyces sp. NBC_01601]
MTPRHRNLTASVAICAALAALSACNSDSAPREHTTGQVTAAARTYISAWLHRPSQPKTMCTLETKAARPNADDGGDLAGCIRTYEDYFKDQQPSSADLTITISHVQDVPATGTRPAGKGALATVREDGVEPFRYALRLVQQDGRWRIAQRAEADESRYAHTEDPVADVLERTA